MSEQHQDESAEESTGPIPVHESWLPTKHPLHRPRHGNRQRFALVCAVAFLLFPAVAFVVGVRPEQIENHKLAEFPGIAHGFGMFTGMSRWATDNLPARAEGIRAEDAISQGLFGELPPKGQGNSRSPLGSSTTVERASRIARDRSRYPDVLPGKDGWLFYGWDVSMKCVTERPLNAVVASIARFERIVRSSGRKVVVLIPPDKSTVFPRYMPDHYAGKKCMTDYRRRFWPAVTGRDHVLDMRSTLQRLRRTHPGQVYFKKDTHWEDRSAIAALRAVCERIQPGVTRSWTVSHVDTISRPGDLSRLLGSVQTDPWPRFQVRPDGVHGTVTAEPPTLRRPVTVHNKPTRGMITQPTVILGDSFSRPIDRYAASTFSNVTFGSYEGMDGGINHVQHLITNSKVVVLEMLERGAATGESNLLKPQQLDQLAKLLRAHPK